MKTFLLILLIVLLPGSCLANRAAVAILHSTGNIASKCVPFDEDKMTGLELLTRAGLNPVADRGFITEIDGEKAQDSTAISSSNDYWFYYINPSGGNWEFSQSGAANSTVVNGQTDGWQIGGKAIYDGLKNLHFSDICKAISNPTGPTPAIVPVVQNQAAKPAENSKTQSSNQNTPAAVSKSSTDPASEAAGAQKISPTQTQPKVLGAEQDNKFNKYTTIFYILAASIALALGLIVPVVLRRILGKLKRFR